MTKRKHLAHGFLSIDELRTEREEERTEQTEAFRLKADDGDMDLLEQADLGLEAERDITAMAVRTILRRNRRDSITS